MDLSFSFIIPVYNRPEEIRELLESLQAQTFQGSFEVVIVEDGSQQGSENVVAAYKEKLTVNYLVKPNTGPGDSRNFGIRHAAGNYCIILDSDCILPPQYLQVVSGELKNDYVDFYGGPDAAHESFSLVQKAINYAMTSILTTGGIRGKRAAGKTFQPRSFNMGISKQAFEAVGGFGLIHPGEDPDLSIRLHQQGYSSHLIPEAFVYHKRRINFSAFHRQVKKFGLVRPILNMWHPHSAKITYWFPSFFLVGLLTAAVMCGFGIFWPILLCCLYLLAVFVHSGVTNASISVGILSVIATLVQFLGYGYGFLKSTILVNFSKRKPEELFPELFF